jgi:preprotein translocase subunit SecF
VTTAAPARRSLRQALRATSSYDIVGRWRTWLLISAVLLGISLLAFAVRGLNFGIDFTGGAAFAVTGASRDFTAAELEDAIRIAGVDEVVVQAAEGDDGKGALVSTPAVEEIGGDVQAAVIAAIAEVTGTEPNDVTVNAVGARWGAEVTRQALRGLAVFLVLVIAYLSVRFEWRMAVAAIAALVHDLLITVGVYALVGFEVTPSSVIALLTILGYSLYDSVIVFDRVRENTASLTSVSNRSYGEVANTALNDVLVRSLSTSVTALLPVGALLFIGANLLGASTLRDLALALFVGMGVGTYSSIFVATPLLVAIKEREPRYAELRGRADLRRRTAGEAGAGGAGAAEPASVSPRGEGQTGTPQSGAPHDGPAPAGQAPAGQATAGQAPAGQAPAGQAPATSSGATRLESGGPRTSGPKPKPGAPRKGAARGGRRKRR